MAASIANKVRETGKATKMVGVFRDASADYVREIATLVGLDHAQLHGSETDEDVHALGLPVIKTLRVGDRSLLVGKVSAFHKNVQYDLMELVVDLKKRVEELERQVVRLRAAQTVKSASKPPAESKRLRAFSWLALKMP